MSLSLRDPASYRRRDIRTRPRLWWGSVGFGDWPTGLCAVCGETVHGDVQYFYQFEEGRERLCVYCHRWTREHLRV